MKTAYLKFVDCSTNDMTDENFSKVGNNSGNIVFDYSLMNTIKSTPLTMPELRKRADEFDNIVVRDFIWIKENVDFSYFKEVMNFFKYKAIIPISAGLQSETYKSDFKLHKNTVAILQEISERAEIAVRGEYTAEIFNKYGIKNIRIIGCPSLYLGANYGRKIVREKNVSWDNSTILANYKTLVNELDDDLDKKVLNYLIKKSNFFIEQTKCYFSDDIRKNVYNDFINIYRKNRRIFFIFKDWYKFCLGKTFSIGARFHGNVVPVLAGVPSLFLIFDSRTKELTDFFKLPTLRLDEFDENKSLQYYYDLADYSEFNKIYKNRLDNFVDFCLKNNLELYSGTSQFFYRKLENLRNL